MHAMYARASAFGASPHSGSSCPSQLYHTVADHASPGLGCLGDSLRLVREAAGVRSAQPRPITRGEEGRGPVFSKIITHVRRRCFG